MVTGCVEEPHRETLLSVFLFFVPTGCPQWHGEQCDEEEGARVLLADLAGSRTLSFDQSTAPETGDIIRDSLVKSGRTGGVQEKSGEVHGVVFFILWRSRGA